MLNNNKTELHIYTEAVNGVDIRFVRMNYTTTDILVVVRDVIHAASDFKTDDGSPLKYTPISLLEYARAAVVDKHSCLLVTPGIADVFFIIGVRRGLCDESSFIDYGLACERAVVLLLNYGPDLQHIVPDVRPSIEFGK